MSMDIIKTNQPQSILNPEAEAIPQVTAILETPEQDIKLFMSADVLYFHVHKAIQAMLNAGVESGENQRLAQMIRAAVKGVLLMYGHKIIDSIWRGIETPAPRPGKGDDIITWYTDFFTRISIMNASRSSLHLLARDEATRDVETIVYQVTGVRTESISSTGSN